MKDYAKALASLNESGRLRYLKPLAERRGCRLLYQGHDLLNLSANDYLGLAGDADLHRRFYERMGSDNLLSDYALGAASSRLLTGDSPGHHALEDLLAKVYGAEAALLMNSGYHANIGILPALLGKGDLILSDKLNHASIHDGLRLGAADHKRYRHCDYDHLDSLLALHRAAYGRVVIASESVFSMDGDVADLARLVALKKKYDCWLYIDEAHAIGLYGDTGLGKAQEQGMLAEIDVLIGTFGKALASVGAFVICSSLVKEYLINTSRSLIFTTALPPVTISWNHFILREVLTMTRQRHHLHQLAEDLRRTLRANGLITGGTTNIVPVLIGDDREAMAAAARLQQRGYLIFPVRPPAVPEGTARFRLSLAATMQWDEISDLAATIAICLARSG